MKFISNKEADKVKHQGQVIWCSNDVNISEVLLYLSLPKRLSDFFVCLKSWMLSICIRNENGKWIKNMVNAKQLKMYVFLQCCQTARVARTILFSQFTYICTQFLVLFFLNHKAQDALLCCENFIKTERSYVFAFWQSGRRVTRLQ